MARKVIDCRDYPSDTGCTLTIAGEEAEVLAASMDHAVSVHGESPGPELRQKVMSLLKDESPAYTTEAEIEAGAY
jgi:predicted small metal-binding protein